MHVTIQLDEQTARQLGNSAKNHVGTLECLIVKAIHEWLERNILSQWPKEVQCFKGMSDIPLLEACRNKLVPPPEDPLA